MTAGKTVTGSLSKHSNIPWAFLGFFIEQKGLALIQYSRNVSDPRKKKNPPMENKNIVLHVSKNNVNITILDTLNLTFVLLTSDVQVPSHP